MAIHPSARTPAPRVRPRADRSGRTASLVAAIGGLTVLPLFLLPRATATGVAGLLHFAALAVALVVLIRSVRHGDPSVARVRRVLAIAVGSAALGGLVGLLYVATEGAVPVPSAADPITLAWVPVAAYGFWLIPRRELFERVALLRLSADAAVAMTSLLFVSWIWVLEPMIRTGRGGPVGQGVELAYPLLDVVMVSLVISLLPRVRADVRGFLHCVAPGLMLIALSDSGSNILVSQRGASSFGWPDVTVQAGLTLLTYAAFVRPQADVAASTRIAEAIDRNLPYLPVVAATVLGLTHIVTEGTLGVADSVIAAVMLVTVLGRQLVVSHELVTTAQAYHRAAVHDGLTGLANRAAFLARLDEQLATPGAGECAIVIMDLDGFKEVNDTLGHAAGDRVLAAFSAALADAAGTNLAARLGGDEFAVLIAGDDAEWTASEVARVVSTRTGMAGLGQIAAISCSAGVASARPGDASPDVLRRADLAMYVAKRTPGPGHVACFRDEMLTRADRRHLLQNALEGALDRGEFSLAYQPLINLGDSSLHGAEVLLRWQSPDFGLVCPEEFIPLAEESGAITRIGTWVRDTAITQLGDWARQGRKLDHLYLNLAAAELTPSLATTLAGVLLREGVAPTRLVLEITESRLPDLAGHATMQALRAMGIRLALDDFGTGYSSLAQLAGLPIDIVKLDRAFIGNLSQESGRPVMDAIVSLAGALGLATVAEGIEDAGQAEEVARAGLDVAQGFWFGRPMAAGAFAALLPGWAPAGRPVIPGPRVSASVHLTAAVPAV